MNFVVHLFGDHEIEALLCYIESREDLFHCEGLLMHARLFLMEVLNSLFFFFVPIITVWHSALLQTVAPRKMISNLILFVPSSYTRVVILPHHDEITTFPKISTVFADGGF